ncbi:MAG: metallopeptidase [Myxococcaceae bacterium]|nr:metallopeptidase [Myxococcaceae bacterium]
MTTALPRVALLALALAACKTASPVPAPTVDAAPADAADAAADAPAGLSFRGRPLGEPDRAMPDVDAIGYELDLAVTDATPGAEAFRATLRATFLATRALTSVALDLEGNEVDEVSVDGAATTHTRTGDRLDVALPQPVADGAGFVVSIRYHGVFLQGRTGAAGFNTNGGLMAVQRNREGRRVFMSLDWPGRTRRWLPVRDHPRDGAMIATRLTFPAALTVVSNGRRVGVTDNGDETRTWEYEALTPMPIYDLHVGAYDQWVDQETPAAANGVVIHHYDYSSMMAQANAAYADIHETMNFYTDTFGAYRWGAMAFLQEPAIGGGMEHATVVSMEETMFTRPRVARNVAIHELAHHWSGNLVRIATWNDLWLSEGFSDYLTGRYIESHDGAAGGLAQWQDVLRQGLTTEHAMRDTALLALRPADPEADPLRMFTLIVYKHGAFTLRMLEAVVGREALTTFLRGWFDRHAYGAAGTEALRTELEAATQRDLRGFFDQWVYGVFHPVMTVTTAAATPGMVAVTVRQVQTVGPTAGFSYPLELELRNGSMSQRVTVAVTGRETTATVAAGFTPTSVVIDPEVKLFATAACGAGLPDCRTGWTCTASTTLAGVRYCLPPAAPQ